MDTIYSFRVVSTKAGQDQIHFIRPGKPVENCYVESFNGKFRDERLNDHWFIGLDDARLRCTSGKQSRTGPSGGLTPCTKSIVGD